MKMQEFDTLVATLLEQSKNQHIKCRLIDEISREIHLVHYVPEYAILKLKHTYCYSLLKDTLEYFGYRICRNPNCSALLVWRDE